MKSIFVLLHLALLSPPSLTAFLLPTPALVRDRTASAAAAGIVHAPQLFQPLQQQQQHPTLWRRFGVTSTAAEGGDWDVESVRQQLEHLMGDWDGGDMESESETDVDMDIDMDAASPAVADKVLPMSFRNRGTGGNIHFHAHSNSNRQLTVIGRMRRATEIDLLGQLKDNLNAVDALHDFWMQERGSKAARALLQADDVFQQGEASWNYAEQMFHQLIQEHGPTWAEPLHRMAMLYYLQGRLVEARTLEEHVLQIKPWHIGSLSNYVRIAESQRDVETALQWAAYRLPPRVGRRRTEWVDRAVKAAQRSLANDEQRLSRFLGRNKSNPTTITTPTITTPMNRQVDTAWQ